MVCVDEILTCVLRMMALSVDEIKEESSSLDQKYDSFLGML